MLSINAIKDSGIATNYFQQDDYYARDGESPEAGGSWFGAGAAAMGLDGKVDKEVFRSLLDGKLPDGTELGTIREKGGEKEHRPGWDLTFSAPKSVSILALSGGDERLRTAHDESVREALTWLESELAGHRRRGLFGIHHEQSGNITAALFQHATNRESDPQLHTHSVVMNVNQDAGGKWRSINSEKFYEYKMALGNIYRATLAQKTQAMGYEVERVDVDGRWELKAVAEDVRQHYSQRREQIEEAMKKFGLEGAEASERIALMTRKAKETVPMAELISAWNARNASIGFDPGKVIEESRQRGPVAQGDGRTVEGGVGDAITRLSDKEAVFSKAKLLQWSLAHSMGHGDIKTVEAAIAGREKDQDLRATRFNASDAYTTPAAMKAESDVLKMWRETRSAVAPALTRKQEAERALDRVAKGIRAADPERGFDLNAGQTEAALSILTQQDRFIGVIGRPGVGKTTMLGRVRPVLEQQGFTPVGLAGNANAARTIQDETGIKSGTLASHLRTVRGLAAKYDRSDAAARSAILAETSKQVWIIDEASQINTRDMRRTMKMAMKLQARVVMLGDDKQLAAIEAGQPFAQLVRNGMKTAVVTENTRQRQAHHRQAVQEATEGKIAGAMETLAKETRQYKESAKRIEAIVKTWQRLPEAARARTAVVTARNAERTALNEGLRGVMRAEGKLRGEIPLKALTKTSAERVELAEVLTYRKGDVVAFGRDNAQHGLSSAEVYRVVGVDRQARTVQLEIREGERAGERLTWSPATIAGKSRMGVELFRERETSLAPGEKIQWGKNFASLKFSDGTPLLNGNIYTVDKVAGDELQLRNKAGGTLRLDPRLLKGQAWDHAYATTTFKAQGRTEDHALINAESNRTELFSQKAFLVAVSRQRDTITLFTDSRNDFVRNVSKHTGDKSTVQDARNEQRMHFARVSIEAMNREAREVVRKGVEAIRGSDAGRKDDAAAPAAGGRGGRKEVGADHQRDGDAGQTQR